MSRKMAHYVLYIVANAGAAFYSLRVKPLLGGHGFVVVLLISLAIANGSIYLASRLVESRRPGARP
jgi:hypothetical protein